MGRKEAREAQKGMLLSRVGEGESSRRFAANPPAESRLTALARGRRTTPQPRRGTRQPLRDLHGVGETRRARDALPAMPKAVP